MSTSVSTPHPRRTGRLAGAQSASVPQREGGPGLGHRQADGDVARQTHRFRGDEPDL